MKVSNMYRQNLKPICWLLVFVKNGFEGLETWIFIHLFFLKGTNVHLNHWLQGKSAFLVELAALEFFKYFHYTLFFFLTFLYERVLNLSQSFKFTVLYLTPTWYKSDIIFSIFSHFPLMYFSCYCKLDSAITLRLVSRFPASYTSYVDYDWLNFLLVSQIIAYIGAEPPLTFKTWLTSFIVNWKTFDSTAIYSARLRLL